MKVTLLHCQRAECFSVFYIIYVIKIVSGNEINPNLEKKSYKTMLN